MRWEKSGLLHDPNHKYGTSQQTPKEVIEKRRRQYDGAKLKKKQNNFINVEIIPECVSISFILKEKKILAQNCS